MAAVTDRFTLRSADDVGWHLLDLLALAGWSIAVTPAFIGQGVIVACYRADAGEVRATGASVAELALDLYEQALERVKSKAAGAATL